MEVIFKSQHDLQVKVAATLNAETAKFSLTTGQQQIGGTSYNFMEPFFEYVSLSINLLLYVFLSTYVQFQHNTKAISRHRYEVRSYNNEDCYSNMTKCSPVVHRWCLM